MYNDVCLMMYEQLREVLCAVMHPIMLSRSESPVVSSAVCSTACNAA